MKKEDDNSAKYVSGVSLIQIMVILAIVGVVVSYVATRLSQHA